MPLATFRQARQSIDHLFSAGVKVHLLAGKEVRDHIIKIEALLEQCVLHASTLDEGDNYDALNGRGEDFRVLGWDIEAAMRDELAQLAPSLADTSVDRAMSKDAALPTRTAISPDDQTFPSPAPGDS